MNIFAYYTFQNITTRGKNNMINIEVSKKKNYGLKILNINSTFKSFCNQNGIILKSSGDILENIKYGAEKKGIRVGKG